MSRPSTLKVANAAGYWGDDPDAFERQLRGGPLDYLTMDYLAETTMSILQRQREADPHRGYAHDFPGLIAKFLPEILEKKVKIVANAGGVNPHACAEALRDLAAKQGLHPKIGVVGGDDILSRVAGLRAKGVPFSHLDTGASFTTVSEGLCAANLYLGAKPIAAALAAGAEIVVTGRVYDAALALGPMIYEFHWQGDDWDRLAAGVVAGHILECGAQATGGNFTDWEKIQDFDQIGFPIVEMEPSGVFVVTKTPRSGGLVSVETVKEQLVYEILDPSRYVTPDVIADFTSLRLESSGRDRVKVTGVRGGAPSVDFKVSMAYRNGFRSSAEIYVSGPRARKKAEIYAARVWKRCGGLDETLTERIGLDALHRSLAPEQEPNEIVLRLSARCREKRPLEKFGRVVTGLLLSGPPGLAFSSGVPKPQEIISFWPTLLAKSEASPAVSMLEGSQWSEVALPDGVASGGLEIVGQRAEIATNPSDTVENSFLAVANSVSLLSLCLARSGDKGNSVNIGVLARNREAYDLIKVELTAQRVKNWFQELCLGRVLRYELPNLEGFNFVLEDALAGGGMSTLRVDALGKTFAQALLRQRVKASR